MGTGKHFGKHLNLLRIFSQMPASYQQTTLNEGSKHGRILFIYSSFWPANYNQVLQLLKNATSGVTFERLSTIQRTV